MNLSKLETISNLFAGKEIRSVWNSEKEEYYFSVVDLVGIISESKDKQAYWRKLKQRLREEGNEIVTNCHTLKLKAQDGKIRLRDAFDTKGILRLIESVPSPKE